MLPGLDCDFDYSRSDSFNRGEGTTHAGECAWSWDADTPLKQGRHMGQHGFVRTTAKQLREDHRKWAKSDQNWRDKIPNGPKADSRGNPDGKNTFCKQNKKSFWKEGKK